MTIKGHFTVDVYDCTINITISDNLQKSINYYLKKYDDYKIDYNPSGYCYSPSGNCIGNYYIFFEKSDLSVDLVNHEKSHLVDYILEDRNIKSKGEIRSYLDGFISHKLNKFFQRRGIKMNDKR